MRKYVPSKVGAEGGGGGLFRVTRGQRREISNVFGCLFLLFKFVMEI